MDISKMSEQEKSVKLIGLMPDCEISGHWSGDIYVRVGDAYEVALVEPDYLYNQRVMWLAWRVLNWVARSQIGAAFDVWWSSELSIHQLRYTPAQAQATWLDMILELAIEAGMIKG